MQTAKATETLNKAEWLFCLDFNTMDRTRKMSDILTGLPCTKILLDHHQQPQVEVFDYGISDVTKVLHLKWCMILSLPRGMPIK